MPIECEIVPRSGASPEELTALGNALLRWYVRERGRDGVADSLDVEALADLLNGRLPPGRLRQSTSPWRGNHTLWAAPVFLGGYEMESPDLGRLKEAVAVLTEPVACVRFRAAGFDFGRAAASLRTFVDADWVEDVRIGGRSWNADGGRLPQGRSV